MKTKIILSTALILISYINVSAQSYNKIMSKAIKKAIGSDLKGYQVFSYPTDNFGLITSYEFGVSDVNFLCDMWNCIGFKNPPSEKSEWLSLNNFAAIGSGGSIELSETKQQKVALNVILPKIYDIVGVDGGLSAEKTTDITITIGKAYLRKLRRDEIVNYINNSGDSSSIKKAYNNGNLVLIIGDCIIEDLTVTVKVDNATAAKLDSKIGNSATSAVFKDVSLTVNVEKNVTGSYTFKVEHPIIYARLAKKQPSAGTLGVDEEFNDWGSFKLQNDPTTKAD